MAFRRRRHDVIRFLPKHPDFPSGDGLPCRNEGMRVALEEIGPARDQEAQKKRILQGARPLRHAPRATREGLAQIGRLYRASRRAKLLAEGEDQGSVYILASGRIRLERALSSGRTMHLAHLGRGDLVGDLAL